jgi:hypothetical protein
MPGRGARIITGRRVVRVGLTPAGHWQAKTPRPGLPAARYPYVNNRPDDGGVPGGAGIGGLLSERHDRVGALHV